MYKWQNLNLIICYIVLGVSLFTCGKLYEYNQDEVSCDEAVENCKEKGMSLLTVKSTQDIEEALTLAGGKSIWVRCADTDFRDMISQYFSHVECANTFDYTKKSGRLAWNKCREKRFGYICIDETTERTTGIFHLYGNVPVSSVEESWEEPRKPPRSDQTKVTEVRFTRLFGRKPDDDPLQIIHSTSVLRCCSQCLRDSRCNIVHVPQKMTCELYNTAESPLGDEPQAKMYMKTGYLETATT